MATKKQDDDNTGRPPAAKAAEQAHKDLADSVDPDVEAVALAASRSENRQVESEAALAARKEINKGSAVEGPPPPSA